MADRSRLCTLAVAAALAALPSSSRAQRAPRGTPQPAASVTSAGAPSSSTSSLPDRAERVKMHPPAQPLVGRSALCGDGSFAVNESRSRSCTGHGGVAQWTDGSLDTPAPVGTCRDGSAWYNTARGGACRGHGGVASWKGGKQARGGREKK